MKMNINETETQQMKISEITTTMVAERRKLPFKHKLQQRTGFAKLSSFCCAFSFWMRSSTTCEDYVDRAVYCRLLCFNTES